MLNLLLFVALTAAPALDTNKLQRDFEEYRQHAQDEVYLQNLRVRLPALSVWDTRSSAWTEPAPQAGLSGGCSKARLRILHLWAHWCAPCTREFKTLKSLEQSLRKNYVNDVEFIYVSVDTSDPSAMQEYLKINDAVMPVGPKYGDSERELTQFIEHALPEILQRGAMPDPSQRDRMLPLPISLVLDRDDMVRQAFVGPIEKRRAELTNGVARLHAWAKERDALVKTPCSVAQVAARRR